MNATNDIPEAPLTDAELRDYREFRASIMAGRKVAGWILALFALLGSIALTVNQVLQLDTKHFSK